MATIKVVLELLCPLLHKEVSLKPNLLLTTTASEGWCLRIVNCLLGV